MDPQVGADFKYDYLRMTGKREMDQRDRSIRSLFRKHRRIPSHNSFPAPVLDEPGPFANAISLFDKGKWAEREPWKTGC